MTLIFAGLPWSAYAGQQSPAEPPFTTLIEGADGRGRSGPAAACRRGDGPGRLALLNDEACHLRCPVPSVLLDPTTNVYGRDVPGRRPTCHLTHRGHGARAGNRTLNLPLTKRLLCQVELHQRVPNAGLAAARRPGETCALPLGHREFVESRTGLLWPLDVRFPLDRPIIASRGQACQ